MYRALSSKMTDFLVQNNAIDEQKQDVYAYGLELLFSSVVNLVLALAAAAVIGRLWYAIVFLALFMPLRQFAGGYHAPNHLSCGLMFIAALAALLLLERAVPTPPNWLLLVLTAPAAVVILVLAPVEDHNKPLSKRQVKQFQGWTRSLLTLYVVIGGAAWILLPGARNYTQYLFYSIISVALLVSMGYLKNRKEKNHEKSMDSSR